MENKAGAGKIAIIGAMITAIAGIITTIVTISAPIVDKRLAIQTTQTREAALLAASNLGGAAMQLVDTPTPRIQNTLVVEPAQPEKPTLAAAPTLTLAPLSTQTSPPPASDAQAGMLRVGETFTSKNGISVQLKQIEFPAANEVHLHFTFTNQSAKVMKISLDHNRDVTLTDDAGGAYNWATAFTWEVSIYPGTTRNDEIKRRGDVSKAAYFIVKLEIPGVVSATWRN